MGAGLLLTACDDTGITDAGENMRELQLVMGTSETADATNGTTRALPTGYSSYGTHYSAGLPAKAKIQGYVCDATTGVYSGVFSFTDESNVRKWTSRISIDETGTLSRYFYGFLPKEAVTSATIAPNTAYENGAVITLNGLDALLTSDICVVVGAKDFVKDNESTPLPAIESYTWDAGTADMATRLGKFNVTIQEKKVTYLYLLADHIFSRLQFKMNISADYDKLRTIKVKKISLKAATNSNQVVNSVNAVITLTANTTNTTPITSVAFTNTLATTGNEKSVAIFDKTEATEANWLTLTTAVQEAGVLYVPTNNTTFFLETTYNVYDKTGYLIREDQTVVNKFSLSELARSTGYTYTITVTPTYLYSLSQYDLDNPTVTVH